MTDHIAAARQVLRDWCTNEMLPGDYAGLTRLIAAAITAAEARVREECAKIAEASSLHPPYTADGAQASVAAAIRARKP